MRGRKKLDVIHLRVAGSVHRLTDLEGRLGELGSIFQAQIKAMIGHQIKPVPPISDIANNPCGGDAFGLAVGQNVSDADTTVSVQDRGDDSDRSLDPMFAGMDLSEMLQGRNDPDHAVTTHAKEACIVEKNDPCCTTWVLGGDDQCTNDDFVPAWLANDSASIVFEFTELDATKHDASGLASGVGIND